MSPHVRVLVYVVGGCASDPAEFRPAKNATSYPPVRDAYRIPRAPEECIRIGSVHAEGQEASIEDIAKTAARHGATHYVVGGDQTEITGLSGFVAGATAHLTADEYRTIWARVYRCPA